MAHLGLVFDATAPLPEPRFGLTFGRSRSEVRWQDRRAVTFTELGDLLRQAPVGGKDGPCYTPAVFSGTVRRKDQATEIHVVVLDADCGHTLEEIRTAIAARGWRAIIHSTHSHLTDRSHLAAAPAEKWLTANPGASIADYMVAKAGYLPRVVAKAEMVDEVAEGAARNLIVQHAPCPKFRVILPLDQPWIAAEFETQDLANAKWRERIGALAHALRLHHDQSCVDTSRLFYLPRRRSEDQPFEHVILDGEPCDLWDLPDAAPVEAAPSLFDPPKARAPHLQAVDPTHKTAVTPDGEFIDLTTWAAQFGGRFEVADALRARSPSIFSKRRQGVKHHIYCPNAGSHITNSAEGTGSYVVNASQVQFAQMPSVNGFVIHCMHNGCAGLDRLDHLKALLEAGTLTPDDLAAPAFLTPDIPQIDPSAILESKGEKIIEDTRDNEEGEDEGNIPPALYTNLPGVLGLKFEWVMATSKKPQPALTLGCGIAFFGGVLGQRVQLQYWGTRPNMMILGVGHSGIGKEWPMSACKAVAWAAGAQDVIGPEELSSDAGVMTALLKEPAHVMLIDEVGHLISATNAKNAGMHVKGISSTLLKAYSSSHTTMKTKAYADGDRVKTLNQPCMSFYGTCTPGGLANALTSSDITNGMLSRMVIFDAGDRDPRKKVPSQEAPPLAVVDWVMAWRRINPMRNPLAREGGEPVIDPIVVMMTDEAHAISEAFDGEIHDTKIKARKRGTDALYARAHENALKFALIRACAAATVVRNDAGMPVIDESSLVVDATTMRWAVDLSRATVIRMEATTNDIADTQFQADMRALRKLIKGGGARGVTQRELARTAAGRHPEKMLKDLLTGLTSAGEVFWLGGIKTGGRPRDAYVHAAYIHLHGHTADQESPDQ